MIAEMKARLGSELERLSQLLATRMPHDLAGVAAKPDDKDAEELQRIIQRRIRLLGQLVAGLASVDPNDIWPDRAGYGSVVRVRDLVSGMEDSYTLMVGDFIDLDEGQVSLASPIGHALMGRRTGEQVSVMTPRGERRYEILALTTLPETLALIPEGRVMTETTGSLQVA